MSCSPQHTRKKQFQDFWLKYGRVNTFSPSPNYIKVTVKNFFFINRSHELIKAKNEVVVNRGYDSNGMLETKVGGLVAKVT